MLLAVGAAAAIAGTVSAQPGDIRGRIEFEGGGAIPEGRIEIYIDDPKAENDAQRPAVTTDVESDGGSKTIDFSLSSPTGSAVSAGAQIVARLERADGWLLARGSARLEADSPVSITLYTAMY